jgi:predicted transcriptional regulator
MNAIYKINDIISRNKAVMLLRVNSKILNNQQFVIIKEELKALPGRTVEDIELDDNLFDILKFVYDQNKHNIMVTYQKISKEFSISKVTTGKRINILKDKNLISIEIKGRSKSVNLTDNGNELLNRRGIV